MKAILLGAGYATRLGELTRNKPKALLELEENKPILNYIMEQLETIPAIDEAILISNSKFYNQFKDWSYNNFWRFPVKVLDDGTSSNETRLGAIGDIMFALKKEKINDDIIVLATDTLFKFQLVDIYKDFMKKHTDMAAGKYFPNRNDLANRFGVATLDKDNKIVNIVEKPASPESNIGVFAIYIYKKETLPLFDEYKEKGYMLDAPGNFLSYLYTVKPVNLFIFEQDALDIGTPESYAEARALMRENNK